MPNTTDTTNVSATDLAAYRSRYRFLRDSYVSDANEDSDDAARLREEFRTEAERYLRELFGTGPHHPSDWINAATCVIDGEHYNALCEERAAMDRAEYEAEMHADAGYERWLDARSSDEALRESYIESGLIPRY